MIIASGGLYAEWVGKCSLKPTIDIATVELHLCFLIYKMGIMTTFFNWFYRGLNKIMFEKNTA
jgi:hypothetical protein